MSIKYSTNKVELTGQVQGDIAGVEFENGEKMVMFYLATRDLFKGIHGEKEDNMNWHKIQAFGKIAAVCEKHVKNETICNVVGKIIAFRDGGAVIQIHEILIVNE